MDIKKCTEMIWIILDTNEERIKKCVIQVRDGDLLVLV